MSTLEKIDRRKNIILLFLVFVFSAAFIDHLRISSYFLYEVFLSISCVGFVVYMIISKRLILLKHWITIPYLLIIVWSLAEMLLFDGLKYAPKFFVYALVEIFVFINIVVNFVDKENYGSFIRYTCWVFMALSFILMGYYFSHGVFINFNSFGQSYSKYLLGFGAVCGYYLMLTERKVVYGVLTYVLLILCVLSLVRKMWLALFFAVVVITVLYLIGPARITLDKKEYRKSVYMILSLLLAIIIAGAALIVFVPRFNFAALESLGSVDLAETSYSDMARRLLNETAIERFMQSPIIGNGWGDRLYLAEAGINSIFHNCYLAVLCQLGLIGFVLYYGVFTYPLVRSIMIMKKKEYFHYGLFILTLWIFAAIILYYMPINRMPYYLWGPPLTFTLIFEAWAAKKNIVLRLKKRSSQA